MAALYTSVSPFGKDLHGLINPQFIAIGFEYCFLYLIISYVLLAAQLTFVFTFKWPPSGENTKC